MGEMTLTLLRRQENHAQDVFIDWVGRMMAVTPIDDWGWELKYLLETWYQRDGVLFTEDTYDRLQHWMAAEQEVAWDAERRFGTRDDGPIQLASKISTSDELPARLLFDEEIFQFFDPHTGRRISEEEILAFGADEAAPPELVGFDALLDFTLPPGGLAEEDFSFEPLFASPESPSLIADIEEARQRGAELEADEEAERASEQSSQPPTVTFSRQQAEEIRREEERREIERLRGEGVIVPEEPSSFDLMLEGGVSVAAGPAGKAIARGLKTGASKAARFARRQLRRFRRAADEAADAAKQAAKQADEVGRVAKEADEVSRAAPPTSRGPGVFKQVNESMSGRAAAYQSQISGQPVGRVYEVRGVKFDGFESGTLLEAKGPGLSNFVKNDRFINVFQGADKMISQATQQLRAAGSTRIEWHVAEEGTAKAITNLFEDAGIKGINVIHTPAG